jgi:hypothetical protein
MYIGISKKMGSYQDASEFLSRAPQLLASAQFDLCTEKNNK